MFKTTKTLTATTLVVDAQKLTFPVSIALSSVDAGRKIELSFDGGTVYHQPTYDFTVASQIVVAAQAGFTHCKLTGAIANTVHFTEGRNGTA